ncbi:FMN-binding negative transcriptional regulator [Peterkaempfera bronchialis]|uniref:FMN-binding negative transcriptional regulator n=1 Tax=Peterkaempfera bronchialis TaxID=2126346 RepID=A0A345SYN7_9ACTN|nr:FMN-binding negative transcriptional regulator [Peterkaempfera bronchialis]AXI78842.1 FMN-binding negative transcriptional regulator [Peterkaempfera bronchialis]
MYAPPLYRSDDLDRQHKLIEAHRFGLLTAVVDGRPHGTHIPFVLDRGPEHGPRGRLRAHLAKVNPVVPVLAEGAEVMVAFLGPHTYICPDDYATEEHFPTWLYSAAHVYGRARLLDDEGQLGQIDDLIAAEEARRLPKKPWTLDRVPRELVEEFRTKIVAFELPVDHIDGIFKYSQNKSAEDIGAQIAGFRSRPFDASAQIADLIHAHNADKFTPDSSTR